MYHFLPTLLISYKASAIPSKIRLSVDNRGKLYTCAMVDPDAPSRKQSAAGQQWLHFLWSNIKLQPDGELSLENATELMSYAGPTPPSGTGLHRYVFLCFQQHSRSQPKRDIAEARNGFQIDKFAERNDLGNPKGCHYFLVEHA